MTAITFSHLYRFGLITLSVPLLFFTLIQSVAAQPSKSQVCQMQATGLMVGAKQWRDLKMPKEVGLQQMGLRAGGPRYLMADRADSSLNAGKAESDVITEVQAFCMTFDLNTILDDESLFDESVSDEAGEDNAFLCSDLATSVTNGTEDAARYNYKLNEAMLPFLMPDNRSQPYLTEAVQMALDLVKSNTSKSVIAQTLLDYCEGLETDQKTELEQEFYSE